MSDRIDIHLKLKKPYPVSEFHVMFNDYLRSWASKKADHAGFPFESLDRCKLYADHVGLEADQVQRLLTGETQSIPAQVLRDMRLRITRDTVLVPQKREVLTRDR